MQQLTGRVTVLALETFHLRIQILEQHISRVKTRTTQGKNVTKSLNYMKWKRKKSIAALICKILVQN